MIRDERFSGIIATSRLEVAVSRLPRPLTVYPGVFIPGVGSLLGANEIQINSGEIVFEIGTGSGILSTVALSLGASSVTAIDVNKTSIENAAFNFSQLQHHASVELLQLTLDKCQQPYSLIGDRKFDVVIANPPWFDFPATEVTDFVYADPGFKIIYAILDGLEDHLNRQGRMYLVYCLLPHVRQIIDKYTSRYLIREVARSPAPPSDALELQSIMFEFRLR